MTRWTATGTQDGDLPDLPATGRSVTVTGISIDHFGPDGKMTDGYTNWDTLGMMQQLGAVPDAAQTPSGTGLQIELRGRDSNPQP